MFTILLHTFFLLQHTWSCTQHTISNKRHTRNFTVLLGKHKIHIYRCGRKHLFTQGQELAMVKLVSTKNDICLHHQQQRTLANTHISYNINRVSIASIRGILVQHNMNMKFPTLEEQRQSQRTLA